MPEVYSKATIVCLPSYREGFPKSLLEAASSGLPIVAFDVPGCREIVSDGVNGLLIPFKNVDAMYLALLKLVENKALSIRMGIKGREIVKMNFSQDIIASQTIEVWNSIK
jgi:glycosyltransferase involved in cell wall biosynthesis